MRLIDLLASCAEGEGRYVESLCQTLMGVDEIISVLNNRYWRQSPDDFQLYYSIVIPLSTLKHYFIVNPRDVVNQSMHDT